MTNHDRKLASLGPRVGAGAVDGLLLAGLTTAYSLVPLLTTGMVVPMWGVLLAVIGYAVVPLATFRATLGMKLFGLEVVGKDGHAANAGDLLFRELIGRGFFPAAFLFTLWVGFLGSLLGVTSFVMPSGLSLVMAMVCVVTFAVVLPGHVLAVVRDDRRSLADLLGRTRVVAAVPRDVPADDDERAYLHGERRRRALRFVVFEVVLAAAVLLVPYALTRPTASTEEYADRIRRERLEKDFEKSPTHEVVAQELAEAYRKLGRRKDANLVESRHQKAVVAELGCDKRLTLRFGERMNGDRKYAEALAAVAQFEKRCGEWPRLLWVSVYAHQQRDEWKEVAEVATRLIEDAPSDADFWWWRAEARAETGEYEQAAADYHQSLANSPNGFAASRYAAWVRQKLQRPCEGAFAMGYWMDQRPERVGKWAQPERSRLYLAGDCDAQLGTGRTTIKLSSDAPVSIAPFAEGGTPGRLAVTPPWAGYTLLRSEFAREAGVEVSSGAVVQVYVNGAFTQAKLATVPELRIGEALAENVRVAVVEQLPDGLDAVLGVNLSWRFKVENDGERLTFRPLTPANAAVVR